MHLESQVCNLEDAKLLKELGVEQGKGVDQQSPTHISYAVWVKLKYGKGYKLATRNTATEFVDGNDYAAFSTAELGTMLPKGCCSERLKDGSYGCEWREKHLQAYNLYRPNEIWTEADARAKLLIYLLENGLVAVGEVNYKLGEDNGE